MMWAPVTSQQAPAHIPMGLVRLGELGSHRDARSGLKWDKALVTLNRALGSVLCTFGLINGNDWGVLKPLGIPVLFTHALI